MECCSEKFDDVDAEIVEHDDRDGNADEPIDWPETTIHLRAGLLARSMAPLPLSEVLVGVYLGLLAALFPGFIAFSIGFGFKYFTNVTVPGLGVVALGGALAGVSGGLMGLVDPALADAGPGSRPSSSS